MDTYVKKKDQDYSEWVYAKCVWSVSQAASGDVGLWASATKSWNKWFSK